MKLFTFKTKEEKEKDLLEKLHTLNKSHVDIINTYCKIRSYIFLFKGFEILDNKICVAFIDKKCNKGYYSRLDLNEFQMRYDWTSIILARQEFLTFKEDLEKIGITMSKNEHAKLY